MWELVTVRGKTLVTRRHEDLGGVFLPPALWQTVGSVLKVLEP